MYLPQKLYSITPAIYFVLGIIGLFVTSVWFGKVLGFALIITTLWIVIQRWAPSTKNSVILKNRNSRGF